VAEPGRPDEGAESGFSQPSAPSIEVPRGGGAVRGIDEKFAVNPVAGTGTMSIPLVGSPGRSKFGPRLALSYDSGSGNGPFGFGWKMDLPAITRKTDKGLPRYDDAAESDVYILSSAEDLVPVPDDQLVDGYSVRRYRPRVESLFARIERWTNLATGEIHWRSVSRSNVTTRYGTTENSRIADPADPARRIFSWLISESWDDNGNAIVYEYVAEDDRNVDLALASEHGRSRTANRYPKRIRYGNRTPNRDPETWQPTTAGFEWHFELVFDYDEGCYEGPTEEDPRHVSVARSDAAPNWATRPDAFSSYRSGFEVRIHRRCRRVLMFHRFDELGDEPCLVRSTDLEYRDLDYSRPVAPEVEAAHDGSTRVASFLQSVEQAAYVRDEAAPVELRDGKTFVRYLRRTLPPIVFGYSKAIVDPVVHDLPGLDPGFDLSTDQWVDLDGEGLTGVLEQQGGAWLYRRNEGDGRFGPPTRLPTQPQLPTGPLLIDLAGDGRLHAVSFAGPAPGAYERTKDGSWETMRTFDRLPNLDWGDPEVRLVDLTGDGRADVLVPSDRELTWYPSRGERGFGSPLRTVRALDERAGPRLVAADPQQAIYLADMSGDGLSDLVRIRNGEVCYWPNLGYGRFGPKVTMDGAPRFDDPAGFDERRVRLADIDGSGTTDLLYVGPQGAAIYANQSGNGFRAPTVLRTFPVDDPSGVSIVDVLGTGTACIVWSATLPGDARRPTRFAELMSRGKPHLLVRWAKGSTVETHLEYAPSTRFYLADRAAGRPWLTRIPFPVHVVERVQTLDLVGGGRLVKRYAYHDGHYDPVEREFRGFGLLEQTNSESFASLTAEDRLPVGSNVDEATHVPPTVVRTRFHLGRAVDGGLLPPGLTSAEEREAYRSLKGSQLSEEVYARDGGEHKDWPYTVTETSYLVRMLQPRGRNRHGIFFAHDAESISYHRERTDSEPRVQHELNLEVDDFGNVLRYVKVAYGRERADPFLEPDEQAIQGRDLVAFTENEVTNPVDKADAYRLPQPCSSRTYELTGLSRGPGERFTAEGLTAAIAAAHDRGYEQPLTPGRPERRLIEHLRTVYRRDDLRGPLPAGALESLALPYEQYRLAFTPELVAAIYGDRVDDELLEAGSYVRIDGSWWLPSGQIFYSPDAEDSPDDELAEARAHFFVPRRFRTPFGADTLVTYDHDMFVSEVCDALGNRTTVGERNPDPTLLRVQGGYDIRVLEPRLVMDPNRNRNAVAFDALGLVVGSAAMGAPEDDPVPGDRLTEAFRADLAPEEVEELLNDPVGALAADLLGEATTRIVYDLEAEPPVAVTINRQTHLSDLAPGEQSALSVSIAYSDGFGRVVQKKSHAEPDADGARWSTTGWTIFNNKGKPVRKYEPFFSRTPRYEHDARAGVSVFVCYDPLDRVVASLHPNRTWEKLELDPWGQASWDVADTVLVGDPRDDPTVGGHFARLDEDEFLPTWYQRRAGGELGPYERAAAEQAAQYAGTPRRTYCDALGHPFLVVDQNRSSGAYEQLRTRVDYDVEGNQREIRDAVGRLTMRYDFSIAGSRVHQASMEAGERWVLPDAGGLPLCTWDSRGHRALTQYDVLRRPERVYLRDPEHHDVLVARTVYGESLEGPEPQNLRTRAAEEYDQAGLTVTEAYDFKGNVVRHTLRLATAYREVLDWSGDVPLEDESFATSSSFDARNKPVEVTHPDGTVVRATYNEAGLLDHLVARLRGEKTETTFVEGVDYDARGLRTEIRYGNGARTAYRLDPETFRLRELHTHGRGRDLQRLAYVYDPVGNVTHTQDDAQQRIFFRGRRVDPSADYAYDAIYRLTEATGREQLGPQEAPYDHSDRTRRSILRAEDGQALARFVERYTYDAAGNLLSMRHRSLDPSRGTWTRRFEYEEESQLEPGRASNRLTCAVVGRDVELYSRDGDGYDADGNMLRLPHLAEIQWDYRDQLRMTARQRSAFRHERTWYVYNGEGRRVRTVTERPDGTIKEERLWIGLFEVHRKGRRAVTRETLNVMDDKQRVALVETRAHGHDRGPAQLVRYQLADRLGSGVLELDDRGRVISYEEFSPYGSTTLQAIRSRSETPKRYRFTAKERDEQSGFYYHGARYYAPWLARWTAADPAGPAEGPNLYAYVLDRPSWTTDPTGTDFGDAQEQMMGMMWDRMGQEISGIIEGIFGGHAYVNPRANTVDYAGPKNGVGGMVGGVVRAGTLRAVPVEDNPTLPSLMGMEAGAGMVPILDPGARLVTGTTVTGQDTSRGWAALQFGLDVLPFAAELHAASGPSRALSMESRMVSTESRMLAGEIEVFDAAHIGTSGSSTRTPTITNPSARGDLCVADVGAHQANLRNPGGPPITNEEFVQAAGRPVSRLENPIQSTGEAANFLNEGFAGLAEQGRISTPITAEIPKGPITPGEYMVHVDGPMGGHAIHATVTDEVIGRQFISGGKFVTEEAAAEIIGEGGRVIKRPVYRTEFYDPQEGVCLLVQPGQARGWVRMQ
jgi:RHS repeat-associated protein